MKKSFFVGVDGGATKTLVRVEDAHRKLIGQHTSGAANIKLSVSGAWDAIESALNTIFTAVGLAFPDKTASLHGGMGLAGCEMQEAYQQFLAYPHHFHKLTLVSDAYIACLGAHGGQDGAIIIAGTGVVGLQIEQGTVSKVGGYGFPHDDLGGGAWLGLEAARVTCQWLDGRLAFSPLAQAVFNHFKQDENAFVAWVNQANSTQFATLAPFVITCSQQEDPLALELMHTAGKEIDKIATALLAEQTSVTPLPCALVGGITAFLTPYLSTALQQRLCACLMSPAEGAILMMRQQCEDLLHDNR